MEHLPLIINKWDVHNSIYSVKIEVYAIMDIDKVCSGPELRKRLWLWLLSWPIVVESQRHQGTRV